MSEFDQLNKPEVVADKPLDKGRVLDLLFEVAGELGIDIEEADVADLLGEDDNDFLGNLVSLALMNGVDEEELLGLLGIELEQPMQTE